MKDSVAFLTLVIVMTIPVIGLGTKEEQNAALTMDENESYENVTTFGPSLSFASLGKVILLKNTTTCTMYSKKCFIRMIMLEPGTTRKGLKVKSVSKKFVELKSIESCVQNNTIIKKECRVFENMTNIFKVCIWT